MEPVRTAAVVIEVRDYGESDKIVTFYSQDRGRMSGIAKGAKRSLKRFVNKLELFTLLEIHFTDSRSSSLVRLDQADILDHFPHLRTDYSRYTGAILLCELLLQWTRENDPDANIFELLQWGLAQLDDRQRHILWVAVIFQLKLFTLLGFQPRFDGCTNCGRLIPALAPFHFRPALSGLICAECGHTLRSDNQPFGHKIDLSTIKLLQRAQEMEPTKLSRLHFTPQQEREAALLLRAYGDNILQREIFAWQQLLKQAVPRGN